MPKLTKGPIEKSCSWVIRLLPGEDLKKTLKEFLQSNKIQSAVILSGVGSLIEVQLRLANSSEALKKQGPFEIVSLTGTLSVNGMHLHMSVADRQGQVWGGHLLDGNLIFTTAEIVLLEFPGLIFERKIDPVTKYLELELSKI